jgi:hypothetical protein
MEGQKKWGRNMWLNLVGFQNLRSVVWLFIPVVENSPQYVAAWQRDEHEEADSTGHEKKQSQTSAGASGKRFCRTSALP